MTEIAANLCIPILLAVVKRKKLALRTVSLKMRKIEVPQGSVLGPVLFTFFINDLFLNDMESEVCNFADDNIIYARGKNLEEVILKLEDDLYMTLKWLSENGMVANSEKFQLMFLGTNSDQELCLKIDDQAINQFLQVNSKE